MGAANYQLAAVVRDSYKLFMRSLMKIKRIASKRPAKHKQCVWCEVGFKYDNIIQFIGGWGIHLVMS